MWHVIVIDSGEVSIEIEFYIEIEFLSKIIDCVYGELLSCQKRQNLKLLTFHDKPA